VQTIEFSPAASKVPGNSEANPGITPIGFCRKPESGSCLIRGTGPVTTPNHAQLAARIDPGGTIGRRPDIRFMPAIPYPFTHVAADVMNTEWTGAE